MHTGALLMAGTVAVAFAVLMLMQRTLYASAICCMAVLLQIAAVFYLLGAELLAFLQVLVYAGAIMVMVVVSIMATPPRLRSLWSEGSIPGPLAAAAGGVILFELASFAAALPSPSALPWPTLAADFGSVLFGPWAVLTEAVALLIFLAALAVVEAWRPK